MYFNSCLVALSIILNLVSLRCEFIDLNADKRLPCPCGSNTSSVHSRVVGGHNAGRGQYPYASCLIDPTWRAETMEGTVPFCGATLISDSHVITAAHCVKDRPPDSIIIDIGDYDLLDPYQPKLREVKNIFKFPEYVENQFHSDIAIIEFEHPVKWSSGVKAAWLPPSDLQLTPGTTVTAYGWGRLKYSGGHPRFLQSVELPVTENNVCQSNFKTHIDPSMICAGGQEGHDACIGDSGSGLVVRLGNEFVLCGVVSFGRRCALPNVPGVYTRISSYIDWIYNNTLSSKCKPCISNSQTTSMANDSSVDINS